MPPLTAEQRRLRGQLAAETRWCGTSGETRRAYVSARAEDQIRSIVDAAPQLTPEQRARLAVLLLSAPAPATA